MSSKGAIIGVGFNNEINFERVLTILNPQTVAGKKLMTAAKADGTVLDVTMGRKVRSVILFDNRMIMLSALNPQTITGRGVVKEEETEK